MRRQIRQMKRQHFAATLASDMPGIDLQADEVPMEELEEEE